MGAVRCAGLSDAGNTHGLSADVDCRALRHSNGADLAIAARRPDKLAQMAESIRTGTGRRCLDVAADVTDPDRVKNLVDRTLQEYARIDILINNAGNSVRSSLRKLTAEIWQKGRALNPDSAAYCTLAVGKHFIERKSGVIELRPNGGHMAFGSIAWRPD